MLEEKGNGRGRSPTCKEGTAGSASKASPDRRSASPRSARSMSRSDHVWDAGDLETLEQQLLRVRRLQRQCQEQLKALRDEEAQGGDRPRA